MKSNHLIPCLLLAFFLFRPSFVSAEITTWFAPSATKVLRDAKPDANARQWELAAAGGEVEACQLVLQSDHPASGVVVRASKLQGPDGGAIIPTLLKVEYVPNIVGTTPYPDPLPPLAPLDLQPNQAQPVWISVRVPADAKSGDYVGTVEVQAGVQRIACPLHLRVWGFSLPKTPSCVTAVGLSSDLIARQHGVQAASPDARRLHAAYYEMLLDHRISPYVIPPDLMSDEAAKYLDDPRMTSYQIPYLDNDDAIVAMVARLKKHGWFAKGYFYPIDEPVKREDYDRLAKIAKRLQRLVPDYRWVVPFFRDPNWDNRLTGLDLLGNRVNIWCPQSQYLDSRPKARPYLAARQAMGESVWWYVCCGPRAPYNNFFVDMPAMAHRMLFWQQIHENVGGLLYWSATYWNPRYTKNPWTDMATVKDIDGNLRGDGSLLYPGKQIGVDGPVSSIRLEVIRDGLEDFDYLTLAEARLGKDATQALVAKHVRGLKDSEQDPGALEKTRRELGERLEKPQPPK